MKTATTEPSDTCGRRLKPPFGVGWLQLPIAIALLLSLSEETLAQNCKAEWRVKEDGTVEYWEYCTVIGGYRYENWVLFPLSSPTGMDSKHGREPRFQEKQKDEIAIRCKDSNVTNIIWEYFDYGVGWLPTCHAFRTSGGSAHFSWSELNRTPGSGHPPYGIVQNELWSGLEGTRSRYGEAIYIASGYRCPHGNRAVGGVSKSRHMWGDAADMKRASGAWNFSEWDRLRRAASNAGADFIEPYDQDPSHVHADWRYSS